jgi:hypothetical protein
METDASGYAMGVVLMQGGNPVCYHSELFHGGVLNFLTYDKELYSLVQYLKNLKHYLMGKETIIHIDHHSVKHLKAKSKLQQTINYKWMGFL